MRGERKEKETKQINKTQYKINQSKREASRIKVPMLCCLPSALDLRDQNERKKEERKENREKKKEKRDKKEEIKRKKTNGTNYVM